MYGWPILSIGLFMVMSGRRAVVAAMLGGWLFLPQGVAYEFAGLPEYTRITAMFLGVIVGIAMFDMPRVLRIRWGMLDLPMLAWLVSPIPSSVTNGLGLYDGLSGSFNQILQYGVPYLIGRAYFSTLKDMRWLVKALIAASLIYLPFFYYELRMGPSFHKMVYGYEHFAWHMIWRLGWYRPPVFLSHGITMGLWLAVTALLAVWAWRSRMFGRVLGVPVGAAAGALGISFALSRALNGYGVFAITLGSLLAGAIGRVRMALLAAAMIPGLYVGARVASNWDAAPIVEQVSKISEDRADSLRSRIAHEVLLIDHALKRPIFGWGTYNRNRPDLVRADAPEGLMGGRSITDSLWIIALGQKGMLGLIGIGGVLLLPTGRVALRLPPRVWATPGYGAVVALGAIPVSYAYDGLFNAMYSPVPMVAAGALLGSRTLATAAAVRRPDPGTTWARGATA